MKRALLFSVLAAVLFSVAASATTVVYVPMRKSIQMSDLVLVGHVLSLDAAYNKDGDIVTRVTLLVEESLKGGAGAGEIVTFDAWGGSLGCAWWWSSASGRCPSRRSILSFARETGSEQPNDNRDDVFRVHLFSSGPTLAVA